MVSGLPRWTRRVVRLKFWLAGCATLVGDPGTDLLSCSMLGLDLAYMVFWNHDHRDDIHPSMALRSDLALYPTSGETNPTKIVSGFGGTFCLVLSFLSTSVGSWCCCWRWEVRRGWHPDAMDNSRPRVRPARGPHSCWSASFPGLAAAAARSAKGGGDGTLGVRQQAGVGTTRCPRVRDFSMMRVPAGWKAEGTTAIKMLRDGWSGGDRQGL